MSFIPGICQATCVCNRDPGTDRGFPDGGQAPFVCPVGDRVKLSGPPPSEKEGAVMRSRSSLGWAAVLLSGTAALVPLLSAAFAGESNPVALNTPAPELVGGEWRNTPGNAPLTLTAERGEVTILHFWTFG
jgi:hypothetical protein